MGKKNKKKLLISILITIFSFLLYISSPFLLNFNDERKIGLENLLSELIFYEVNIKGDVKYKLLPFPSLEISDVYLKNKNENSILNKIKVEISVYNLIQNKFSYNDITLDGGEFIIDISNFSKINDIKEFDRKKIVLKNIDLKFFDLNRSFNLNSINGKIFYADGKIKEINGKGFLGEIDFNIGFEKNELNIKSNKSNFKISISDLFSNKKIVKLNFNKQNFLPGINKVYSKLIFENIDDGFKIVTEQFKTNNLDGKIYIKKDQKISNSLLIEGQLKNVEFKNISDKELNFFLKNTLLEIANLFDAHLLLNFQDIETKNKIFDNANFEMSFQNGDIRFDKIDIFSDKNKISLKGRNIKYDKDNLFFFDFEFNTKDFENICKRICQDELTMNKIKDKEFKLKSKGILNLNKAKISIKENFTNKQFNDNELKKLNSNFNSLILLGKLENLFDLSRYFTLL